MAIVFGQSHGMVGVRCIHLISCFFRQSLLDSSSDEFEKYWVVHVYDSCRVYAISQFSGWKVSRQEQSRPGEKNSCANQNYYFYLVDFLGRFGLLPKGFNHGSLHFQRINLGCNELSLVGPLHFCFL